MHASTNPSRSESRIAKVVAIDLAKDVFELAFGDGRGRIIQRKRLGRVAFSTKIASPFSYYDDVLFDITSDALGPLRPVASGGRYDALLTQVGGADLRAVGCMVRPARAWTGGCA